MKRFVQRWPLISQYRVIGKEMRRMFTYSSRGSRSRGGLGTGILGFVMVGVAAACSGNVQLDPHQTSAGGNTAQSSNTNAVVTGGSVAQSELSRGGSVAQSELSRGGSVAQSELSRGGSVAQSELSRGGSVAQSELSRGGSVAHSSGQGGSRVFSTVDCGPITCARAVNCVETCGGPVLQSGCCECPTGTFDSINCQGAGGAGGQSQVSTGGANSVGGQSSSRSAGGAATGGTTGTRNGVECTKDQDCQLTGDCCGCHSLPLDGHSDCPMMCATQASCDGVSYLTQKAEPGCIGGRCALKRNCDDSLVVCKMATPVCPAGRVPSVTADGTCWDGDCINAEECSEVSSCSVCSGNNLMCVYSNGARGVAHCVKEPWPCATNSLCACYGALCNGVEPCAAREFGNYGLSCGRG
ncbi:MAG: hypothetical protein ACM3ZE_26620 [Myxococcales bacterium]